MQSNTITREDRSRHKKQEILYSCEEIKRLALWSQGANFFETKSIMAHHIFNYLFL